MKTKKRKTKKVDAIRGSAKSRERLHRMRMKFSPGYAEGYWKGLGFFDGEISIRKHTGRFPGPHNR